MTFEEFGKKYCSGCGTQRCHGIYDEVCREGCWHYRKEFLGEDLFTEEKQRIASLKRVANNFTKYYNPVDSGEMSHEDYENWRIGNGE